MKIEKYLLGGVYAMILANFIAAMVWGGVAKTGGGVTIPDTNFLVTAPVFIAVTLVQAVIYYVCKNHGKSYLFAEGVLAAVKAVVLFLTCLMMNSYAFNADFLSSGGSGFYSHGNYLAIVIIFLVLTVVSAVLELLSVFKLYCK